MINIHDLYQVMRLRCWYLLVERNKKFWRDAGWPGSLNTNIAKQRSFNSRDILKVTTETKELKSWTNVYSPDWNQNLTVKTSTTSLALPWNCAPGGGARASLAKNWIPSPLAPTRTRDKRLPVRQLTLVDQRVTKCQTCCDDVESFPWLWGDDSLTWSEAETVKKNTY